MIDTTIFNHLVANVPQVEARVYAYLLPQDCPYPAIAFLQIKNSVEYDLSGETHDEQSVYQFSIFGKSYLETKQIADAVRAAMRLPIDGIGPVILTDCSPSYEAELDLYHIALVYQINHSG